MAQLPDVFEQRPAVIQHADVQLIARRQTAEQLDHLHFGAADVEGLHELDEPNRPIEWCTHHLILATHV